MAGAEEWRISGSSCCSPFAPCLLATCCPCVTYGRIMHRLRNSDNLDGYVAPNNDCLIYGLICGLGGFCALSGIPANCNWILNFISRGELRRKYNIKGDGCTDCLCASFCLPCDLVQQDKELENRSQPVVATQPGLVQQMSFTPKATANPPTAPQQAALPPYPPQAMGVQPVYPPAQEALKQ